jgi:general secretion pathway protein B
MSYILDALKKLEHEKSKKKRGDGMVNISGALFEQEQPKTAAAPGWKIALVLAAAVLLTFGITWYFLQPDKGHEKPAPRLAITTAPATAPARQDASPVPPVSTVVPVVPVPSAALESQAPPAVSSAPAVPAKSVQPRPLSRISTPPDRTLTRGAAEDSAALLTMQELGTRTKERQPHALTADQTVAAPADIKLSGIAWQDERRARRAVVNGFLMQEGGFVSGARITDIFQDRVRFSLSGKFFEIPLVSSGVPATGK